MATTVHQKIRIYDLAKELKLDNKKVMEDARREGIDVSVPSNTVPHEVAERIRLKYFPKKVAPAAGPRLVKHAKVVERAEPAPEAAAAEPGSVREADEPALSPAEAAQPEVQKPKVRVLKATPQPKPTEAAAEAESHEAPVEPRQSGADSMPPLPGMPAVQRPPTQVRVLRPRPGAPAPSVGVRPTGSIGAGVRAAEGGVATETGVPAPRPRTTYVPQDTGRPRKRTRRGKREFGHEEGKHIELPRHMRA